jgi:hypothetical protein
MDMYSFNTEGLSGLGMSQFESMEDFCTRLENKEVSDEEILSKFDENQKDYISDLQESPDWQELDEESRLNRIYDAVKKFCHNTEVGRYWSKKEHWMPMAMGLLRYISTLR